MGLANVDVATSILVRQSEDHQTQQSSGTIAPLPRYTIPRSDYRSNIGRNTLSPDTIADIRELIEE